MSELDWKPLANQSEHEEPWCRFCNDYCSPSDGSCRCCLAAEVEALREKVKQHEVVFKVQAEALKSTREQVQRVRDVTVPVPGDVYDLDSYTRGAADALALTNKALDGDGDASGLGQRVFDAENTLANVRDWADRTGHYVPGQITDWQRGFLTARREVRQLLDGTDE
jgi:hypothetical protein